MAQARDEAGNVWEVDPQGNYSLVQQAPTNAQPIGSVDPRIAPTARKDVADANRVEAITPADVAKTGAEATKAKNEAAQSYPDRPTLTPDVYKDALDAYNSARQLDAVISDLENTYKAGPGSTKGVMGFEDSLPLPSMQNFNRAGDTGRGIILRAMGFAATQANTPNEVKMNIGAYIPSASDYDTTIRSKIDSLKSLRDFTLKSSVRLLGGMPDDTGHIVPLSSIPPDQQPTSIKDGKPLWAIAGTPQGGQGGATPPAPGTPGPSVWQTPHLIPGGPQAASFGATQQSAPIPPAMQQEYDQWFASNARNFSPEAYAAEREKLDKKYGFGSADPGYYAANGKVIEHALKNGGDINQAIPGPTIPMTSLETLRNNAVNNPVGAAIAGAANAGSFGLGEKLVPEKYNVLANAHPGAVLGGEVLGTIEGSSLLGGAGRAIAKRVAPQLLKDAPLLNRLRQLGTDVGYGAIYGQNTEGDPLKGALSAGIGSAGGQVMGKVLGDVVGGVATSPAVQRLKDAGVNLTTGQTLGGMAKGIEDRMTSIPVIGNMISARRLGGYQDFQRAAFNEGLSPINATVRETGELGVGQARDAVSNAYQQALAGKQFAIDPQFHADVSQRVGNLMNIPKVGPEAAYAVREALVPYVSPNGTVAGEYFQNMRRDLLTAANKLDKNEAATGKIAGDEVRGVANALDEMVGRQDPSALEAYTNANEAYRNSQIIRKAVSSGKNTEGMFTPAQLGTAADRNAAKYGGTDATTQRPFFQLQRDAQTTLPSKVPESGTTPRLLQAALGASMLGGGAGVGAASSQDQVQGAQNGLGAALTLGALLTLGGTRGGQRVLNSVLTERPAYMRKLGDIMLSRPDVFGAPGARLAIDTTH